MFRTLALAIILWTAGLVGTAAGQSLDGTWLLYHDPADPALTQVAAAGGRLPQEEIDQRKRIVFDGTQATVHVGETTISMTITPNPASWGVDAQVSDLEGSAAPITFLRIEMGEADRGTLTSYTGQTPLERFAIMRVGPAG